MKNIRVLVLLIMLLLFGSVCLGENSYAKSYTTSSRLGHKYYNFIGTLTMSRCYDNTGTFHPEYILKLEKPIRVKNCYTKKVSVVKKMEVYKFGKYKDKLGEKIKVRGDILFNPEYSTCKYTLGKCKLLKIYSSSVKRRVQSVITPKIVKLKTNKIYTDYDVTGDGYVDKVKVISIYASSSKNTMKLYVNGKKVYSSSVFDGIPEVKLLLMDNKKTLIEASHWGESEFRIGGIFSYRNSNWIRVMNVEPTKEELKYGSPQGRVKKITSSTIIVEWVTQNAMVGMSSYLMEYEYTDEGLAITNSIVDYSIMKLKESGDNNYTKEETMIARCEMDVYDKVEDNRVVMYHIMPDDEVKFMKIQRINGRPWFYVSIGYFSGWLRGEEHKYYEPTEEEMEDEDYYLIGNSYYFKNALFAG